MVLLNNIELPVLRLSRKFFHKLILRFLSRLYDMFIRLLTLQILKGCKKKEIKSALIGSIAV